MLACITFRPFSPEDNICCHKFPHSVPLQTCFMLHTNPTQCFIKTQKHYSLTKSILLPSAQKFVLSVEKKHLLDINKRICTLPLDLQHSACISQNQMLRENKNTISQIPGLLIKQLAVSTWTLACTRSGRSQHNQLQRNSVKFSIWV